MEVHDRLFARLVVHPQHAHGVVFKFDFVVFGIDLHRIGLGGLGVGDEAANVKVSE